eukprot:m.23932 g.23932  ORF g.23932 m.23932 type:complete len:356 (-) comp11450_c0_seq1:79-1146(-)
MQQDDFIAKQPKAFALKMKQLQKDARPIGLTLTVSHTSEHSGGCLSIDQAENFPGLYDITSDEGHVMKATHVRDRSCGWLLADFMPGCCCYCPLLSETRLYPYSTPPNSSQQPQTSLGDDWQAVVDFFPHDPKAACPCLIPCADGTLLAVKDKEAQVESKVSRRGYLESVWACLAGPCLNQEEQVRHELQDRRGLRQFMVTGDATKDNLQGCSWPLGLEWIMPGCLLVDSCACCACGEEQQMPLKHQLKIKRPDGSVAATVYYKGESKGLQCLNLRCCHRLEEDYSFDLELPTGTTRESVSHQTQETLTRFGYTAQEARLLLAYAMWYDQRFVMPTLNHSWGPRICTDNCITCTR